jgi:hypothetical protein
MVLPSPGLEPQDIDILVTNCSIYCPTPSLASMLVNHFKFRQDIEAYNLGGMGCSNGVTGVGLIKNLLLVPAGGKGREREAKISKLLACCKPRPVGVAAEASSREDHVIRGLTAVYAWASGCRVQGLHKGTMMLAATPGHKGII